MIDRKPANTLLHSPSSNGDAIRHSLTGIFLVLICVVCCYVQPNPQRAHLLVCQHTAAYFTMIFPLVGSCLGYPIFYFLSISIFSSSIAVRYAISLNEAVAFNTAYFQPFIGDYLRASPLFLLGFGLVVLTRVFLRKKLPNSKTSLSEILCSVCIASSGLLLLSTVSLQNLIDCFSFWSWNSKELVLNSVIELGIRYSINTAVAGAIVIFVLSQTRSGHLKLAGAFLGAILGLATYIFIQKLFFGIYIGLALSSTGLACGFWIVMLLRIPDFKWLLNRQS